MPIGETRGRYSNITSSQPTTPGVICRPRSNGLFRDATRTAEGSCYAFCVSWLEVLLICSIAEGWAHYRKRSICLALCSSQISLVYLQHTICIKHNVSHWVPDGWHQAVYIVSRFRLISVKTPRGRYFSSQFYRQGMWPSGQGTGIKAMLSHPA